VQVSYNEQARAADPLCPDELGLARTMITEYWRRESFTRDADAYYPMHCTLSFVAAPARIIVSLLDTLFSFWVSFRRSLPSPRLLHVTGVNHHHQSTVAAHIRLHQLVFPTFEGLLRSLSCLQGLSYLYSSLLRT
jgi:hypothetical protein